MYKIVTCLVDSPYIRKYCKYMSLPRTPHYNRSTNLISLLHCKSIQKVCVKFISRICKTFNTLKNIDIFNCTLKTTKKARAKRNYRIMRNL